MMDEFKELLSDVREDVDFEKEEALVDDGILNSFDILQIISAIGETFDLSVPASEIVPGNFNSAKAMQRMIERLQEEIA